MIYLALKFIIDCAFNKNDTNLHQLLIRTFFVVRGGGRGEVGSLLKFIFVQTKKKNICYCLIFFVKKGI